MSRNKKSDDIYTTIADQIIDSGADLSQMFEKDGLLKQLTKRLLEKALDAEMDSHLGYSKHQRNTSTNSRNGYNSKTLSTDTDMSTLPADLPRQFGTVTYFIFHYILKLIWSHIIYRRMLSFCIIVSLNIFKY